MLSMLEQINLNPELGQVLTPENVALRMVQSAAQYLPKGKVSILDPAVGPATFLKAIQNSELLIKDFDCYDIDQYMCAITSSYCKQCQFETSVINKDFLLENKNKKYDFIILNPPYIRQENLSLDYKLAIKHRLLNGKVKQINGRSNLFIYFLYKCLIQLSENGVMCAIVYDSVLHTQYGHEFINYVEKNFSIIKCENIQTPFEGAIIDASILIIKNDNSLFRKAVSSQTEHKNGFTSLSELLSIRRGTALPSRKMFLAHPDDGVVYNLSQPIIMKPSDRKSLVIDCADSRYYSFGLHHRVDDLLLNRLKDNGMDNRTSAFNAAEGSILLNYYIRKAPKHIFNQNGFAASDNFYVCEAEQDFPNEAAWLLLNSSLYKESILKAARNQGNGLKKLQVYEYKKASAPDWRVIPKTKIQKISSKASVLIKSAATVEDISSLADQLVREVF